MKDFRLLILNILLPFLGCVEAIANEVCLDSVEISVLTCQPGKAIHEAYGHTALRVHDLRQGGADEVLNYGTFSYGEPHFLWRFLRGRAAYWLSCYDYELFLHEYEREGRGVTEQVLRLTPEEKERLMAALRENLQPGNSKYVYNFLYDNCTTRAIRQVESAVGQNAVIYPPFRGEVTFRQLVNGHLQAQPWNRLGIALMLGAEVDRPINVRQTMFAPLWAERWLDSAVCHRPEGDAPLLEAKRALLPPAETSGQQSSILTPLLVFGLLWMAVVFCTVYVRRGRRWGLAFDTLWFTLQGVTGGLIALLFFASDHPAVDSNWNLLWLNPLALAIVPLLYLKEWRKTRRTAFGVFIVLHLTFIAITLLGIQRSGWDVLLLMLTPTVRLFRQWKR